jgi:(2Fe-2S) ferredoxin
MPRLNSPQELEKARNDVLSLRDPHRPCVSICSGTGCVACGAREVVAAVGAEIEAQGLKGEVAFRGTGCHGFCEKGPIVVIDPGEICYLQVKPGDVPGIVRETLREKNLVERLLYVDPSSGERVTCESDIPFYKHQERMVFAANRKIDPRSIEDYLAIGGFRALGKALFEMSPEEVIGEVKEANLRGRGGAASRQDGSGSSLGAPRETSSTWS